MRPQNVAEAVRRWLTAVTALLAFGLLGSELRRNPLPPQFCFKNMKRHDVFYVYIIQDKNGTYYSGHTKNLDSRFDLHEKGYGAKYLRGRTPLKLVFYKKYRYFKNALLAERRLKRLTRQRKQELIHIFEAKLSAGAPVFRFAGTSQ